MLCNLWAKPPPEQGCFVHINYLLATCTSICYSFLFESHLCCTDKTVQDWLFSAGYRRHIWSLNPCANACRIFAIPVNKRFISYITWQALSQSVCSMFFFVFSFFFRLNKTLLSRTFHDFTGQYNGILYCKLFNQEMVGVLIKSLRGVIIYRLSFQSTIT